MVEPALLKRRRIEKLINHLRSPLVPHVRVVRAVSQQQLLIVAQKRSGIRDPFVPQQHQPSARLENANKFPPRPRAIKPVRRLRRSDKIHTWSASVVASAVPATLVNFGNSASSRSPACRISALGSTPKTGLPFSSSTRVQMPVPEAMSAMTCRAGQSAFSFEIRNASGGYPGR